MHPNSVVREKIDSFDSENGGDAILFERWFYYENGASREENPLGALIQPPSNEVERLRIIIFYHGLFLKKEVVEFDEFKSFLQRDLGVLSQQDENLSKLQELRDAVRARQTKIEEMEEQLISAETGMNKDEREIENRKHQEMQAQHDSVRSQFLSRVSAIEV